MSTQTALNKITGIIESSGSDGCYDDLFSQLYPAIKMLAQAQLNKLNPGQQLTPTVLANECYLKLKSRSSKPFASQQHFYHTVSRCMRFYLVDMVRNHHRLKRQGKTTELQISQFADDKDISMQLLELNDIIGRLEIIDKELAEITQLKFFSGMTFDEIADLYNCSASHIHKKWGIAKSLLINLLEEK